MSERDLEHADGCPTVTPMSALTENAAEQGLPYASCRDETCFKWFFTWVSHLGGDDQSSAAAHHLHMTLRARVQPRGVTPEPSEPA